MTETLMTIREMGDLFDVTPRTLRFYEAKELIAPIRERQKRLYTNRCRARMKLILRGRRFGFSLEEMRLLLNLYSSEDGQAAQLKETLKVAKVHLATLNDQRDELDKAISDLTDDLEYLKGLLEKVPECEQVSFCDAA